MMRKRPFFPTAVPDGRYRTKMSSLLARLNSYVEPALVPAQYTGCPTWSAIVFRPPAERAVAAMGLTGLKSKEEPPRPTTSHAAKPAANARATSAPIRKRPKPFVERIEFTVYSFIGRTPYRRLSVTT